LTPLPAPARFVKPFTSWPPRGFRSMTHVSRSRRISGSTIRRLSIYLRALEAFLGEGTFTVSSQEMARRSGTTAAQIRKDLSAFGSFGKRGTGYAVPELAAELRGILGLSRSWPVALVGAGRIGSALFEYGGFRKRGFDIVAVLDNDPDKVGQRWGETEVHPMVELEEVVRREGVEIAILAVPAPAVQELLDRVSAAGVRAVLNFAATRLKVPPGVTVNDVNMAVELEALSFALASMGEPGA